MLHHEEFVKLFKRTQELWMWMDLTCTRRANSLKIVALKILALTAGEIYTYLSTQTGWELSEGTFQALTRGYTHWASGHIDHIEVNDKNPEFVIFDEIWSPQWNKEVTMCGYCWDELVHMQLLRELHVNVLLDQYCLMHTHNYFILLPACIIIHE